uniref:Uncharacterized protein n=1 Tax=Romanomermis culicivorax TaxID=13658 RepID=A0A915KGV4_ROMCU
MADPNAMMQAQQQQLPYMPPNYLGLPMPGQRQYYHQFLVPPGLQMPPPTIIPPIRNVQSEEIMDIPGTSMGTQPPQRPPSTKNSRRARTSLIMKDLITLFEWFLAIFTSTTKEAEGFADVHAL